ncbi:MAG TPA: hypothetical protein PLW65_08560 [Pseudomonadota bacterium]|nr:hypothetical protein [Pseudomonadota bacterium]
MASRIYRIVKYVEDHFSSFAVSRLIMLSGVKVRKYTWDSSDDAQDLAKVWRAVQELAMVHSHLDELTHLLNDPDPDQ